MPRHFAIEREAAAARASVAPTASAARTAKPSTLARSNGGTSIGADDVMREHAAERRGKRDGLGRRAARDRGAARSARAPPRRRPLRGTAPAARRGGWRRSDPARLAPGAIARAHGHGLITTSLCAGYPSLSAARNPAIGLRQRRQRHIARGYGGGKGPRSAPARAPRAPLEVTLCVSLAVAWAAARERRPAAPACAAQHVPGRQGRIEPAGQHQHRALREDSESCGLPRQERDAMDDHLSDRAPWLQCLVVASGTGAADHDDGIGTGSGQRMLVLFIRIRRSRNSALAPDRAGDALDGGIEHRRGRRGRARDAGAARGS